MASEGQVVSVVETAVLPGYDMLDVKSEVGIVTLMDAAIFTLIEGPFADEFPGLGIHYEHGAPETRARALRRMRATKSMCSTYLSYSRASAGESAPSFAFSASSSRRA